VVFPAVFLFAALSVKQDQAALRTSCDSASDVIANLPAGTPVEIRFRLADGSDCFKIAASVDGKPAVGYVSSSVLSDLERFERERTRAGSAQAITALNPVAVQSKRAMARTGDKDLDRASQLLEANQPAQALELLESATKRHRNDPNVFVLAGLAAYRSDQLRAALDYWKQSLDLVPDQALARVYEHVRKEAEADQGGEKIYGMHIALRYEGQALPTEAARAVLALLEEDFSRISGQLGCSSEERIIAIVQTRDSYLRSTGAAEWSGGLYDGRIHIAWTEGNEVGPQARRALAHEMVHACLFSIPSGSGPWPAWMHEGLAQKLSGDTLPAATREQLRRLAQAHRVPRLEELRHGWSGLSIENARLAYNMALAAADALYDNYANYGIRNILNNPDTLARITADLDKKLGF